MSGKASKKSQYSFAPPLFAKAGVEGVTDNWTIYSHFYLDSSYKLMYFSSYAFLTFTIDVNSLTSIWFGESFCILSLVVFFLTTFRLYIAFFILEVFSLFIFSEGLWNNAMFCIFKLSTTLNELCLLHLLVDDEISILAQMRN